MNLTTVCSDKEYFNSCESAENKPEKYQKRCGNEIGTTPSITKQPNLMIQICALSNAVPNPNPTSDDQFKCSTDLSTFYPNGYYQKGNRKNYYNKQIIFMKNKNTKKIVTKASQAAQSTQDCADACTQAADCQMFSFLKDQKNAPCRLATKNLDELNELNVVISSKFPKKTEDFMGVLFKTKK